MPSSPDSGRRASRAWIGSLIRSYRARRGPEDKAGGFLWWASEPPLRLLRGAKTDSPPSGPAATIARFGGLPVRLVHVLRLSGRGAFGSSQRSPTAPRG